jgi:hypothetical protein
LDGVNCARSVKVTKARKFKNEGDLTHVLANIKAFQTLPDKDKLMFLARVFCLSGGKMAISTGSRYILLIVHAH